ncbi:hypothetical protein ACHAW5_011171 [Stephanodiscus triporus]|uniref:Protein ENHANCED DISEASE RESISTANCE 2 C-terminal domain-containing protein n=1 Tax=Stephanodiscus triporus TaxID=2934178 RepID=A0ABD3MRL2_9STRA
MEMVFIVIGGGVVDFLEGRREGGGDMLLVVGDGRWEKVAKWKRKFMTRRMVEVEGGNIKMAPRQFGKIDCIIIDSPNSSPREKVEVELAEEDHEDQVIPSRSGRFPKGLTSLYRLGKYSKKNSPVVEVPTPTVAVVALVTSPPPPKVKDDMVLRPHTEVENAPPPSLWTDDAPDPELNHTYKCPRFYLHDPTDDVLWSFHLSQQLVTTLKHASTTPQNAWSEPSASTINIRGKDYSKGGTKEASETSMFSVLGVDSFVNGGKHENFDASSGTKRFLQRWNIACEEVGWVQPPFLLTVNFIVPWGNFQSYFIRPDADNGPFCSRHTNCPSERSWREFLEGSTVSTYRIYFLI